MTYNSEKPPLDINHAENIGETFALVDPGGCRWHAPPPQQDPFLLFLHTFLPKSVRVRGQRPPMG